MNIFIFQIKKLYKSLKKLIKKNRYIFWSLFHPDNLLKFEYANNAEIMTWELIKKEMKSYKSICEIGCFNGRISHILKDFLKDKTYVGYDLNIIAITLAKFLNYFSSNKNSFFYCLNGINSTYQNCELFVSVATLIYFSELELKEFIVSLKKNKKFKCLIMHEIFLNESLIKKNQSLVEDTLNIHCISMIKKEFGNDYIFEVIRTHYPNWENKKKISAIFSIKKNKT